MIYRVCIKVEYCERWFDFENANEAIIFAETALTHQVENEDNKKQMSIELKIINSSIKEEKV